MASLIGPPEQLRTPPMTADTAAPSVREALERIRARAIADDDADEKELRRQLYHIEALAKDAMTNLATPPAPTPSAARASSWREADGWTGELPDWIPDRIDLPPMTDRGVGGQIMDAAWPMFGGDTLGAEFWYAFGSGVEFTLRSGVVPDAAAIRADRHGIYIASKTKHADKWKRLRDQGVPIISTWIDEAGAGETSDFHDLWKRCLTESATCGALVSYREPGEVLKGGWVEIGAALANGVPVYAVGLEEFTIAGYRGITHFSSIEVAIAAAIRNAGRTG
jgi:hypothetical protein